MGTRHLRRHALVGMALVFVAAIVAPVPALSHPAGARTAVTGRPNIVLILTDDQRWDELSRMPTVESQLVGKGVEFTNGFVVNSLCCPSRTTILTGKYSHSTDIYADRPPHGGFRTFADRGEDRSTIATWLQDSGYRTSLIGKYLNGYKPNRVGIVPPGWSDWHALALYGSGDGNGGYYDYTLSNNGVGQFYGSAPSDYSTDVLSGLATDFIDSTPPSQPLFLYFAPRAPHIPATPPPRYQTACQGLPHLRPPSYNEADMTDKPAYMQVLPPIDGARRKSLDSLHLRHCQTLLAVDDAVSSILQALNATGRLDNTFILFASDNGLLLGEHRAPGWKKVPYEESIRIPIVARYDPLTLGVGTTDPHLVLNVDFAPSFADVAGVSAPGVEGSSILPLLSGTGGSWRTDFLVEHWENPATTDVPPFCAVRSEDYLYAEYNTGEEELYDLGADPYELTNLATHPAYQGIKATLHARMVELCSPPPPDFTP